MRKSKKRDILPHSNRSGMSLVTVLMAFFSVTTLMYWTTGAITTMNANIIKVQAKDAINKFQTNLQAFLIHNTQGWENTVAACYGGQNGIGGNGGHMGGHVKFYNDGVLPGGGVTAGLQCLRKRVSCASTAVGEKQSLYIKGGSHNPAKTSDHFFYNPKYASPNIDGDPWAFDPNGEFNRTKFLQMGGTKKADSYSQTWYNNGFGLDGFPCGRLVGEDAEPNKTCPFWAGVWIEKTDQDTGNDFCPNWKITVKFAYNPGASPTGDMTEAYSGIIDSSKYDYSFIRSSQGTSICTTTNYDGGGHDPLDPCGGTGS